MANKNNIIHINSSNIQGVLIEISSTPKKDRNIIQTLYQQAEPETLKQIWNLRKTVYNKIYPAIQTFAHNPYDSKACILYTYNKQRGISSTARIAFDIEVLGIPEKELIPDLIVQLRQDACIFAELGRFVINEDARGALKNYFRAFYDIAIHSKIDTYVFLVRQQSMPFYTRLLKADVISLLDETFGSQSPYAVLRWNINSTPARFFRWSGALESGAEIISQEALK